MRAAAPAALAVCAVACARIGPPFDAGRIPDIEAGLHGAAVARADVERWLGPPHQVSTPLAFEAAPAPGAPGTACVLRWHYGWAEADPGGTTRGEVLVVDFDSEGRVCRVQHQATR